MKKQNDSDNKSIKFFMGILSLMGIFLIFMFVEDKPRDFSIIDRGVQNAVGTILNFIFYGCIFGVLVISIMRFMKKLSNRDFFHKLVILITPIIILLFFNFN